MKKLFSVLLVLLAFQKSFAYAYCIDTLKLLTPVNFSYSAKLPNIVLHPERLTAWVSVKKIEIDSLNALTQEKKADRTELPPIVLHPESLLLWVNSNYSDRHSLPTSEKLDNEILPAIVLHPASLLLWLSVNQTDNPNLSAPEKKSGKTELPIIVLHPERLLLWVSTNHFDGIKLSESIKGLDNTELPAIVVHPESLLLWVSANRVNSRKLPKLLKNSHETQLPAIILHPESLLWSNININKKKKLSKSAEKTSGTKLPAIVLHPESLLLTSINLNDKRKSSKARPTENLVVSNLPEIVLHPEHLMLWGNINYAENLNLPTLPLNLYGLKSSISALHDDNLKASVAAQILQNFKQQIKVYPLDSLKLVVKSTPTSPIKALLYTEIADRYLSYDTVSNKRKRLNFQNDALGYTMLALHQYSVCNDNTGLRLCFDNLAKVNFSQRKYTQAKWFILQSNYLSRAKNDVPNIIASLLALSAVKSEIKDYKLAMVDLDEASQLSIKNHYLKLQSEVLKNYALLYSRMKNYPKEASMLKKRTALDTSISKEEETSLAEASAPESMPKKKPDSIQTKKMSVPTQRTFTKATLTEK